MATAALTIFSVGYIAMSRRVTSAGGFYTFISRGLGRVAGVGSGLLIALCYIVFAAAVLGVMGYFAATTVASLTGLDLPAWVYMALGLALMSAFALFHIELTAKVLGVLLIGEVLVLVVLAVGVLAVGGAEGFSLAPLVRLGVLPAHRPLRRPVGHDRDADPDRHRVVRLRPGVLQHRRPLPVLPGREGVLPRALARVSHTYSPVPAAMAVTAIVGVYRLVFTLADPSTDAALLVLGTWSPLLGVLGILAVQALVCVAIIRYFLTTARDGFHWWATLVAPVIGGLAMVGACVLLVVNRSDLSGAGDAPFIQVLPWVVLVVFVAGMAVALLLRSRRPAVYARLGHYEVSS